MMRRVAVLVLLVLAPSLFAQRDVDRPRRYEGRATIVHPAKALTEEDVRELAAKGVFIKHALPGGRYLARVDDAADVANDPRVTSLEPLTVEKKIERSALREAARARPMAEVNVVFHRDVPFDDARQAVLEAGGVMDVFALGYVPSRRIEAMIAPHALEALAADERVFVVAGARRAKVAAGNANTAALSQVDDIHAAPYGLTGAGVVVSLMELAEAQASHVEFGGRLIIEPTTVSGASSDRRHATHVAGTIGARGVRREARGMAPNVRMHEFCYRVVGVNQCTGNWLSLKENRLQPLGVVADNNSWGYIWGWEETSPPLWNNGDIYWGAYDLLLAAPLDEISNEKGVLFVHSAGNDGALPFAFSTDPWMRHQHYDLDAGETLPGTYCISQNGSGTDCPATTCTATPNACEKAMHHPQTPFDTNGTTASAKNVISVGSVDSSKTISGSSSRGPAKDGRVKPDVVARGVNVLSTAPTDSYLTLGGTSMAAPAVTGIAALLAEQWRRTFAGATPTPAQLKAVIIAGAEDLGNAGPDYTYGFGLVNAKTSADLIIADQSSGAHIRNFTFAQGQNESFEVPLVVSAPQTLRVVLNWSDPAIPYLGGSDDIAEVALVNDLDVKVIDPAGNTWLPFVLDRVNFTATATRGVNKVDNVEMVEIANATQGTYRVVVTGTNVTQGPQAAVLVSSVRSARACFDIQEGGSGNIVSGSRITAGLCTPGDVDTYRFTATKTGAVTVTVIAGDTPLRATLTGTGISRTQTIGVNSTSILSADVNSAPNAMTLQIEAAGSAGAEPQYTVIVTYPETVPPKRRSARS